MPTLKPIAYCQECRELFAAEGLGVSGNFRNIGFHNVKVNCRKGHTASVLNANYSSFQGGIEASFAGLPAHLQRELAKLVIGVTRQEITIEDAAKEAEKIQPGLGWAFFNPANWSDTIKAALISSIVTGAFTIAAAKMSQSDKPAAPPITINHTINVGSATEPRAAQKKPYRKSKQTITNAKRKRDTERKRRSEFHSK